MLVANSLELVGRYAQQDADNYSRAWGETAYGVNWYWDNPNAKLQVIVRDYANVDGVDNADRRDVWLQTQYIF